MHGTYLDRSHFVSSFFNADGKVVPINVMKAYDGGRRVGCIAKFFLNPGIRRE